MSQLLDIYVDQVIQGAKASSLRTGQYLFNHLPQGCMDQVRGRIFDPFHKELARQELLEWIDNHLIFSDSGEIVALFNRSDILWEKRNSEDV